MSAILIDGQVVHYESLGRGRPVVFLHGWLGSWRYWMETMDELSIHHYRTYALDFWGFGDSSKVPDHYTLPQLVLQVEACLEALGIWSCDFVGHALGGLVALGFGICWPDRIGQLVTVSLPFTEDAIAPRLSRANPSRMLDRVSRHRPQDHAALKAEAERTDPEALARSIASLRGMDLRRQRGPRRWLAVHGERDDIVRPPSEGEVVQDPASFRMLVLEGVWHFPMLEEPAKFNRLLRDFLGGDELGSLRIKEEWRRRTH